MRWVVDTADPHQVRAAQRALCDLLRRADGEDDDLDAAQLILSELVGNVVAHAPGPAVIELDWQPAHPTLTIADSGAGFVAVPTLPADPLAEGGRGMFIVNSLAQDVRIHSNGSGTRIEVDLPWSAPPRVPGPGSAEGSLGPLRAAHRLALALQQADGPPAFYDEAVATIVELLGVDRASLLLFDDDGVCRFKAWRGLSAQYRQAVEGHSPWGPEDVDARPILVPDVVADRAWDAYRPVFDAEGIRALAFVPLVHRDRVVGKFMLYYRNAHEFDSAELAVAEVLASHVALALERRAAERDLTRQQEHLQLALAAGDLGTWDWEIPTDRLEWSASLEAIHGLSPGAFAGTFEAFQADVHPEDQPLVLAAVQAVLAGESDDQYAVTYRIVLPDGTHRWVSATGQLLRDADGRPERLLGVCGDVTEQRRLLAAERAAGARLATLQRITAELSRAVGVDDVADVVLGLALEELGASTGSLCMIDGDHLRIARAVGYGTEVLDYWERFSLDDDLPAAQAVRTARPVYLGGKLDQQSRYPAFDDAPLVGAGSLAVLPLVIDGIPLGALVIGFTDTRDFSTDDQALFSSLASQCAAAIARADLYEERERARAAAERSRARLSFLAEASAELGTSLDYQATLKRVAELAVPRLADVFTLHLLEGSRISLVGLATSEADHLEPLREALLTRPPALEDETGTGAVLRTGERVVFRPVSDDLWQRFRGDHPDRFRALELSAGAVVPLVARGRTIGALGFAVRAGREFDDEGLLLAEELAARAGAAIDNARLFHQRTTALRTLQSSLLPPQLPRIAGLDLGACYSAGSAGLDVGGDFYDVFPLFGNRHLVLLGDVCGRGVEAANTALLIRHVTRAAAVNLRSPAAILNHLNEVLLRHGDADGDDPRFCTVVVAVVHPRPDGTVSVTLTLGGHPEPLLRDGAGDLRPVGEPGSVVGATEDVSFTDTRVLLRPGEKLICFTDGATERRRGNEFFGDDGLAAVLRTVTGNADAVASGVVDAVTGFAPTELGDDLAVLVLGPASPEA
ncbi:GAF domain-containing protein [Sporichthya polymorpha]|uniref:GAF domain-containing protein n=1 Tax=Sporichthya polymorpha TaxID=35751 RepID=UPI0009FFC8C7|nr:GAF domain-containing protein [Sporichthya polymorpha]